MADEPAKSIRIPASDEALLAECRVETFRAGGPGGQHQNTSATGVRLVHLPTGTTAVARDERSQHRNKRLALERLRAKLAELVHEPTPRRPTKVPASQKRKRLDEKRRQSDKKRLRKPPSRDEA